MNYDIVYDVARAADKRALKFKFLFIEQLPHFDLCRFMKKLLYRISNLEAINGSRVFIIFAVSLLYT